MPSTVLQLVQMATAEMGLQVPTYVVGNPSQEQVQQLALINAVGNEVQRQFIWQHSTVQYRFNAAFLNTTGNTVTGSPVITNIPDTSTLNTTYQVTGPGINYNVNIVSVDSPTQVTLDQPSTATGVGVPLNFGQVRYVMPADFDRPIDNTHWDVTKHWQLIGPLTAQQWEVLISGWIAMGPRIQYRIWAGYFQIWPVQTTADLLNLEYISSNWVNSVGSFEPDKSSFTLDTDKCTFPDRLMVLGLKKKYFEAKGFDTTALTRDYQAQLDIAYANDKGSANLSMGPKDTTRLIGWANIPDSGFGTVCAVKAQKKNSRTASLAAPVGGWNARDAVATMPPLDAVIMDNVWPTTSDVMLRKGYTQWATGLPGNVETIFAYNGATSHKQFAAAGTSIYDTTAGGPVGAAVVSGMSNARWQYTNVANAGGSYLIAVNGADAPRLYNGTTWSTTAITGVTQANLIHVNLFKNRVWFVEKDTLKAWYLAVDAIAGAASVQDFQSIATKGGYLMAMATWTIDAGEGVDDYAAFITSEGEVIVYQGSDPTNAATWSLKGVWQMGSPIGRRCFIKYGGDLLVICYDGVQPMSRALQSSRVDPRAAITDKIQGAMSEAVTAYNANYGWQLDFCPNNSRVMLNVPAGDNVQMQFAMNTITGGWCRFTGIKAICWEQYLNESYFGGVGYVGKFWDGANDNGDLITGDVLQAFSTFGNPGQTKRWTMAQLFFLASGSPAIYAAINVDYDPALTTGTVSFSPVVFGIWDSAMWDVGIWGGGLATYKPYVGLTGIGKSAGMRLAMVSDQLEIHWQATNFVMEDGAFL